MVVYFVIVVAMVIFHEGYGELVRKLVNGLPLLGGWSQSWSVRTTGRSRRPAIGWMSSRRKAESPLCAHRRPVGETRIAGGWLRSWRLMAIDAVQVDAPDSPVNIAGFGKYEGAAPVGRSRRFMPSGPGNAEPMRS